MVRGICVICLQKKKKRLQPVYLKEYQNSLCECNCLIHEECLSDWYKRSLKCPICSMTLKKNLHLPINEIDEEYIVTTQVVTFIQLRQSTKHLIFCVFLWVVLFLFIYSTRHQRKNPPVYLHPMDAEWLWGHQI